MLSLSHRRLMARLALFAMLLLALAPSVSRLLAPPQPGVHGWAELCTLGGLKWVKLPAAPAGSPAAPDHGDGDCGYCPLAQSLDAVAVQLLQLPPSLLPADAPGTIAVAPSARWSYPSGLGSRGPPQLG